MDNDIMWQHHVTRTFAILYMLAGCGCTSGPDFRKPLPLISDVLHVERPHSVAWISRTEVLTSRHQWDVMPVAIGQHVVMGQRVDRPIQLELVAGGEGAGYAYDWVLLRVTPPLGMIGDEPPIDRAFVPEPEDFIVIMTSFRSQRSAPRGVAQTAIGQIRSICLARQDAGLHHANGDLFDVALKHGRFVPGWSGSPAFVWDDRLYRWIFLGIAVAGDFRGSSGSALTPDGRSVTIVRPPDWVFDLLTPDDPKVTWPDEAP